ncbi:FliM/FliN family flagellar motor switch protein [Propionivibrio dicarboxylicus]|uniref:FliM/FliN family flagellar motor switch protein n=1 Tax=Propionivibrio dicarboxylicus TaxID=83767 RepID=UPI001C409821|nr:FliM/FliN family flagellar motor switch protein [Propionivibrio dicarboxylicus]
MFDLGERSITLGELKALRAGQVLELDRPLGTLVNVRANGRLIATGELVDIDGRLGVSIATLAMRA